VAGKPAVPGRAERLYRGVTSWVGRHPTAADTGLALVLAACTVPQIAWWLRNRPAGEFWQVTLLSALVVAPLIWRRRYPLSTFAFVALVGLVQWILDQPLSADIALLVYLYTVASRYPLRVGVLATGVVEAGALMAAFRWSMTRHWLETFVLLSGPAVASLLLGVSVRNRRNSLSALTARASQLERERDQQAIIAAAAERTRIARDMHDVVAHSLSVMVTLSEGAALKQVAEPERASAAIRQVSATGRQALDEMRRLLGVLRAGDGPQPGSREPQPGLAQLGGLIEKVRATGLAASLTITGTPADLPPGAELTVYRIVQEALTNTLKHAASPTAVTVAVSCGADGVTVLVRDDGVLGRSPAGAAHGHGHGLTGMRERAAVYDGTVSAGPVSSGGWQVSARLPLPGEPL
jgi:signal transduction histidine kinase